MKAQVIQFEEYKYVKLSAVCNTCGASWTAEVMRTTYKKYVQQGQKYICPFCKHADTGLGPTTNKI